MNKRGCVLLLLALLAAVAAPAPAEAAAQVMHFKGLSARASFEWTDTSAACSPIYRVFVYVGQSRAETLDDTTERETRVIYSAFISFLPACETRGFETIYGAAKVPDEDFQIGPNLKVATLNTVLPVEYSESGQRGTQELHLIWAGAGEIVREQGETRTELSNILINEHFNGALREAGARALNFSFPPVVSQRADLMNLNSGMVVVQR